MINAVEDMRHHQRQHTKSAVSGPVFSVPALSGLADLMPVDPGPICTAPVASASTSTSSVDLTSYLGRSVGSGQCVALVQAAQPGLGPASDWTPAGAVQGNTALQPGTPIATFDPSNRYANATDGSSHAAIYLGQDAKGVQVLDQWKGSAAAVRTIPWDNPGATAANTGAAFRVVKLSAA